LTTGLGAGIRPKTKGFSVVELLLFLTLLNSIQFIFVEPIGTNYKFASEGFTICPRTTSLFQDLTSDLPLPLPGAEAFVIPKPR